MPRCVSSVHPMDDRSLEWECPECRHLNEETADVCLCGFTLTARDLFASRGPRDGKAVTVAPDTDLKGLFGEGRVFFAGGKKVFTSRQLLASMPPSEKIFMVVVPHVSGSCRFELCSEPRKVGGLCWTHARERYGCPVCTCVNQPESSECEVCDAELKPCWQEDCLCTNLRTATHCRRCGGTRFQRCPKCYWSNDETATKCRKCGRALVSASVPAAASAPAPSKSTEQGGLARRSARRTVRKTARRTVRKTARRSARKSARKTARRSARKSARKTARRSRRH
jgi:hypothetical protein